MATYDAHVIVRSGRSDWPSKIEDDEGLPEVKLLRQMLGRGGKYANVCDYLYSEPPLGPVALTRLSCR